MWRRPAAELPPSAVTRSHAESPPRAARRSGARGQTVKSPHGARGDDSDASADSGGYAHASNCLSCRASAPEHDAETQTRGAMPTAGPGPRARHDASKDAAADARNVIGEGGGTEGGERPADLAASIPRMRLAAGAARALLQPCLQLSLLVRDRSEARQLLSPPTKKQPLPPTLLPRARGCLPLSSSLFRSFGFVEMVRLP